MKRIVLLTAMAFIAGLFASSMAMGMSHEKSGGEEGAMEKEHGAEVTQMKSTGTHELKQEQVRELQSILKDEGYAVGPVDGIIGPKTRGAVEEFQRDEGLAVTGNADETTLRALAPSAEKQEFFGLSPEFGKEKEGEWEEKEMEKQSPMEGERSKETQKNY